MEKSFHKTNRTRLYESLSDGSLLVLFAGKAPRQSADAFYPFFPHRHFVYLTGIDGSYAESLVFMAAKEAGKITETVILLPPDEHKETWNGPRLKANEAIELSGAENIAYIEDFPAIFHKAAESGRFHTVWLNLERFAPDEPDDENQRFAKHVRMLYPYLGINTVFPLVRKLRTIKAPCEIEAMRRAMQITREGILAMMAFARPGVHEYELKAEYDRALTRNRVITPAFPSIISSGKNNFCIHYYGYMRQAMDGDMILNDVGAQWDGLCNDVSRGWPVNGKFSEKQRLLYTCAYNTSEYMFSIIKPGMPMADVDKTARRYCFEQLKAIGLLSDFGEAGRYIWHGGAHHVGYDVHDVVDYTMAIAPGMVFCVDIGIYCREWGIGFRLEDNCLVTENGCENLSASIPRSIKDIEDYMASANESKDVKNS